MTGPELADVTAADIIAFCEAVVAVMDRWGNRTLHRTDLLCMAQDLESGRPPLTADDRDRQAIAAGLAAVLAARADAP